MSAGVHIRKWRLPTQPELEMSYRSLSDVNGFQCLVLRDYFFVNSLSDAVVDENVKCVDWFLSSVSQLRALLPV